MKQRLVCDLGKQNDSMNSRDKSGSNHSAIVLSQEGVDEQLGQNLTMKWMLRIGLRLE